MFKFTIFKSSIWNDEEINLENFITDNLKEGITQANSLTQKYINNGFVNDYTFFARAKMECNKGLFYVNGLKLQR